MSITDASNLKTMSLKEIPICPVYYSDDSNLLLDFYIPVLSNSISYKRVAGYFCSNTFAIAAKGIANFINNGGTIKLITNVVLAEEDQSAIKHALVQKESEILEEIDNLEDELKKDHIRMLGWMIKNGKLDIKVAVLKKGIEHQKIGILEDLHGNIVSFSGSDNETVYGWLHNDEQFHVFCSWISGDKSHLNPDIDRFDRLWNDQCNKVRVFSVSEAFYKGLVKIAPSNSQEFIKLAADAADKLISEYSQSFKFHKKISKRDKFLNSLWNFQKEAISSWQKSNYAGILSMATGTGKTKTAIGGMIELNNSNPSLFVVICGPQNTIIKQWEKDISDIEIFDYSIFADSTNQKWDTELSDLLIDYSSGRVNNCVVYTTYNTLCSNRFISILSSKLKKPSLLVCDEVHWAGADTFSKGLLQIFDFRLGLSATPQRYMDTDGTDTVMNYFGSVCYEYPLEKALNDINPSTGETFLCPYNYFPMFVELTDDELRDYYELSEKISAQYMKNKRSSDISDYLQRLLEKRQLILINANGKFALLNETLDSMGSARYLLVYCSPQQIDSVQDILNFRNIKNHRFTGEEDINPKNEYGNKSERDFIIYNFEKGSYSALVAMKCLDEGVNILRAENGIFMASSGNPRQYIQRRGRLLRRHPGKKLVNIYDILVVPYLDEARARKASKVDRKILEKELNRYEEFSNLANNRLDAMNKIHKIKELYGCYSRERSDE